MKKTLQHSSIAIVVLTFLASCGNLQPVAQVRDDVYFMPSQAPLMASTLPAAPSPEVVDDYYDADQAAVQSANGRSYYDVAYNDPHYYNQGRFGFGVGMGMGMGGPGGFGMMGYQTGWGGPGWGDPFMGNGMSMSMGYGWGNPYGSMGYGWGSPWGASCYNPWMNDPWGWNSPWGWGAGPYAGPWGSCWNCYTPVVVGGSANALYGHRPTSGQGGGGVSGGGQPRFLPRDPVSLDPARREVVRSSRNTDRPTSISNTGRSPALWSIPDGGRNSPSTRPFGAQPERVRGNSRTEQRNPSPAISSPQRDGGSNRPYGGFDRGGGGSTSPGGGLRSPGTPRPR